MTYVVQKVSGFSTQKVIGSGTVLDTARLRYLIGKHLNVSTKNVHAYILGEHGDSSFVSWSNSYVGCMPFIRGKKTMVCMPGVAWYNISPVCYAVFANGVSL